MNTILELTMIHKQNMMNKWYNATKCEMYSKTPPLQLGLTVLIRATDLAQIKYNRSGLRHS
jgi:hypothetical protein